MKPPVAFAMILLLLVPAVGGRHPSQGPLTYQSEEAYEVYNAVLGQPCVESPRGSLDWENWGCDIQTANPLVIKETTTQLPECGQAKIVGDKGVRAAFSDLQAQSRVQLRLEDKFKLPMRHSFLSPKTLSSTFEGGPEGCSASPSSTNRTACAWDAFNKAHPQSSGWIELSSVGFNEEKTVAAVYVAHHCGPRCGRGFVQVLRKVEGKWKPISSAITGCGWMS